MITQKNPLMLPILNILKQTSGPISEHALIGQLQQQPDLSISLALDTSINLFQTHFMVMNALYQLQDLLVAENTCLYISALGIYLSAAVTSSATAASVSAAALRDYYLDWTNFTATSTQEVEALLADFWRGYAVGDKLQQAYKQLNLSADVDWVTVKKTYRSLIAARHPDKGGDALEFMAIREAYEVLSVVYHR